MIKIKKINRNLIILVSTFLLGGLLIGGLFLVDEGISADDETTNQTQDQFYKEIEKEIDGLNSNNFKANDFNIISAKINASYNSKLITATAEKYLKKKLVATYSKLIYSLCESYLKRNVGNSTELIKWLNQIKSLTNDVKTNFYNGQINAFNYYNNDFPKKVNSFCISGEFDENKYTQLKNEANEMPKLNVNYKNSYKLKQIKSQSIQKLEQAYRNWAQVDSDFN